MNPENYTLSPEALNAHLLGDVMEATRPPGETAANAHSRCAAIVETFRAYEVANAVEAMIACHCITLQFVLNAAMRDANNVNMDPAQLTKTRASAMSISKTLHLWLSKFESVHTRNEARAAEARDIAVPMSSTIHGNSSAGVQTTVVQPRPEVTPPGDARKIPVLGPALSGMRPMPAGPPSSDTRQPMLSAAAIARLREPAPA